MRIAIFSDNFYPELSGISDSLMVLGDQLAKRGHSIFFYVPRYSPANYRVSNLQVGEYAHPPGIEIHRTASVSYPTPTRQGRFVIPSGLRWLQLKKFRPDIIHTQDFFGLGLEALAAKRALRIPLVGTNHTPITEFLRYGPLQGQWLNRLSLRYVAWYYNHCAYVTAPSNGILLEMEENGLRQPHRAISNPIDVSSFVPADSERKQALQKKFNLSPFTVLYTGRLAAEKNIDVIMRAIALLKDRLPEIRLALTGHGSAEENLKKLSRELGIENRTTFFGTVDAETFAELYQAASVFVITSTAETQSLSLMHAMASALPVIGARARALPEYITPDVGYLIEPGDHRALAEKLMHLHDHPEIRGQLGKAGAVAVQKFSAARIANEWENLYAEIIKKRS